MTDLPENPRVLISDKVSETCVARLKERSPRAQVDYRPGLSAADLLKAIPDYHALIIRSETKVTPEVIAAGKNLRVVGRAGIGVDNVDLPSATARGIVVMNTPGGSAVTTAEHAIALLFSLARKIPQAAASMKAGQWEKKKFMGAELMGKTLAVVGLGNIGRNVAERGKALQMKVIAFDPFLTQEAADKLGVEKVTLDAMLPRADFITIHTPLTDDTRNLLDAKRLASCKRGVCIINAARGGIVNEMDLVDALEKGIVGGAALDVFVEEPLDPKHPLLKLDNVIATPHLGASTSEGQEKVGLEVAEQIGAYLETGEIKNSVNFPSIGAELLRVMRPYLVLGERLGSLLGQLAEEPISALNVAYEGEIAQKPVGHITATILKGMLRPIMEVAVNDVNAGIIAKERGIRVSETISKDQREFTSLITVTVRVGKEDLTVSGTVVGHGKARIVQLNGFYLEAVPEGFVLIMRNHDQPGVIGNLGTLLGTSQVNISRMQLGRHEDRGEAIAFVNVDSKIPDAVIQKISGLPNIISVRQVKL